MGLPSRGHGGGGKSPTRGELTGLRSFAYGRGRMRHCRSIIRNRRAACSYSREACVTRPGCLLDAQRQGERSIE